MGTSSGMRVPVDQMTETTSQRQPRRREAGGKEGGGETATRGTRNRIRGGAARASRPRTAKPEVIEAPPRRCGGCARKVGVLSYALGHDPDAALIPVADGHLRDQDLRLASKPFTFNLDARID
jgi:hypothetical protein